MSNIYPFKFLDAYDKNDKNLFFGRDEEIAALYQMVFQTSILMVYGASGTGKTSLIQCGLAGKFQSHDWLSLFVRRGNNLNTSLEKVLSDAGGDEDSDDVIELTVLKNKGGAVTAARPLSPLAKSFKAIYLNSFRPIYLIFDQFEELFILGTRDEQEKFIATVQEILKVEQPVKMIFSIREEYLGYLYDFEKAVPQLMRKKLRVEPMNLYKVQEVIDGVTTLKGSNVSLKPGEEASITQIIFDKIKGNDKTLTIQLPYLQVFLDKLYLQTTQDDTRQAEAVFSMDTIQKMGDIGDILRDFLEEQVKTISQKLSTDAAPVTSDNIWKILSPFATLEGTKEPITMESLQERLRQPGLNSRLISDTVEEFRKSRILRQSEDGTIFELAHDTLAGQIASKRSDEEKAKLEVKRLIKNQVSLNKNAQELFSEKQVNFIEPYLKDIVLTEDESMLIAKSRRNVKKQRQNRRIRIVLVIMGLFSLLTSIYSIQQTNVAKVATKEAIKQRAVALTQRQQSELNKIAAMESEKVAVAARDSAEVSKMKAIVQERLAEQQKAIAIDESQKAKMAERDAMMAKDSAMVRGNIAIQQGNEALKSKIEADKARLKAQDDEMTAVRLVKLEEAKNDAHKVNLLMYSKEYDQALKLALGAYKNNLANGGDYQNDDIYNALLQNWEHANNNANTITQSAVKSMVGLPNNDVFFAGDDEGVIVGGSFSDGILKRSTQASVNGDLISLAMAPAGNYALAILRNRAVLLKINADRSLKVSQSIPISGTGMHGVFLNDANFLVQTSERISRYDINNIKPDPEFIKMDHCSAIAVDGKGRIYIATGNKIDVYSDWSGMIKNVEKTFVLNSRVSCLSLDPSGRYLAAGTYDGGIWLKYLVDNKAPYYQVLHLSMVNDIKFHIVAGQKLQLASASGDKTINLIEVTDGHGLKTDNMITIRDHAGWVNSLLYSRDGKYLFSAGEDHTVLCVPTTMEELYNNLTRK